MESIIKQIELSDDFQIDDIIHAVVRRYGILRPDREGTFLSLSTDPRTREKELEDFLAFMRSYYHQQK